MSIRPDRRHVTLKAASYLQDLGFTTSPAKTVSETKDGSPSITEQVRTQAFIYEIPSISVIRVELKHNLNTRLTHASIFGESLKEPISKHTLHDLLLRNEDDLDVFAEQINHYFSLFPNRKAESGLDFFSGIFNKLTYGADEVIPVMGADKA